MLVSNDLSSPSPALLPSSKMTSSWTTLVLPPDSVRNGKARGNANDTIAANPGQAPAEHTLSGSERRTRDAVQRIPHVVKLGRAENDGDGRAVSFLAYKYFAIVILKEMVEVPVVGIVARLLPLLPCSGMACTGNGHDDAVVGRCRCMIGRRDDLALTRMIATQGRVGMAIDNAVGLLDVIRRWVVEDTSRFGEKDIRRDHQQEQRRAGDGGDHCLVMHFHWYDMYSLFSIVGA